jgi:nicotinate phosphoribosyltransferase
MGASTRYEDLLVPVFRGGQCVYESPSIHDMRDHTRQSLDAFYSGIKRFVNPHIYPVGLEKSLHEQKMNLIAEARGIKEG